LEKMYLEVGKIVNTHGLDGEVKVIPWSDGPEFLLDFDTFYLDGQAIEVESARIHKQNVLICFKGISSISDAIRLKDKVLFINRDDAALPPGQNFIVDLFGLEVRDADSGKVLGRIEDILTPPAQIIYVVRGGEREYMIPAVDAFVLETNVEEGYISVRLIEGL